MLTRRKPLKRLNNSAIYARRGLKMVIAMTEQSADKNGDISKDFLSTGRTGRRNAIADVLSENKCVTFSDLPYKLERMTTNDVPDNCDAIQTTSNSKQINSCGNINTTTASSTI